MAIKSIGRLAASLLLDTRQWTAGFAHAERTAKASTTRIKAATGSTGPGAGRQIGQRLSPALGAAGFGRLGQFASVGAAGPVGIGAAVIAAQVFAAQKIFRDVFRVAEEVAKRSRLADELQVSVEHMRRFELASQLSGRNIKTIVQEFKGGVIGADLERATRATERFGNLNSQQIATLTELSAKSKEFGAAWQSIAEQFAASVAPAFITAMDLIMDRMDAMGKRLDSIGVTWETIARIAGGPGGSLLLSLSKPISPSSSLGASAAAPGATGVAKNPALHFGSMEAVRAIQGMGANPLAAVAKNTADMLTELKPMADDIATIARRDDGLGLEPF